MEIERISQMKDGDILLMKLAANMWLEYLADAVVHREKMALDGEKMTRTNDAGFAVLTCEWCNHEFDSHLRLEDIDKFGFGGGTMCTHCWRFTNPNPKFWSRNQEVK